MTSRFKHNPLAIAQLAVALRDSHVRATGLRSATRPAHAKDWLPEALELLAEAELELNRRGLLQEPRP